MNLALCTLFEGDYHHGVAALANSLVRNGYVGDLWVGYRGELPAWARQSGRPAPAPDYRVSDETWIRWIPLDTPVHLTLFKPEFMASVLEEHAPGADLVAYIDPDIVVKCPWSDFEGWFTDDAISVIEDVNWSFPSRHPKRLMWERFFTPAGLAPVRQLDRYFNAGFVGVPRAHRAFLERWSEACALVVDYLADDTRMKAGGASSMFHSTDQDALNFVLTTDAIPLNTAGPESMDFAPGGYYLSHAVGRDKPWRGGHVRRALRGVPPSRATKAYAQYSDGPIRAVPRSALARERIALRLAAAVGRFYRREG